MLSSGDGTELIPNDRTWGCPSPCPPTQVSGNQTQQDPLSFKNLLFANGRRAGRQ